MRFTDKMLIAVLTVVSASTSALEFESRCDSLGAWDVIDISGGGRVQMVLDATAPPGYGPETIEVDADQIVVLARGARLLNGTIVLLYKELDPREKDADGVLVFGAEYGNDVGQEQNTQAARPHVWLEQDNDSGLHFRARVEENREEVLAERSGLGLVTDAWNETRWIWQKVRIAGGKVRAKYWPAQEPEPAEWPLEAAWKPAKAQRIGFRVASGRIRIAYYAANIDDVPVTPPRAWLYTPRDRALGPRNVPLLFFTNQATARAEGFIVSVYRGDRAVNQAPFRYDMPKGFGRLDLGQTIRERTGAPLIPDDFQAGMCRVEMLSDSGNLDAACRFEILPLGAFGKRIEGVQTLLAAYKEETELDPLGLALRDAAEAHFDHAVRRSDAGDGSGADTSLGYALEALADLNARKAVEWPADLTAPETYLRPRGKLENEPWKYVAGLDMSLPKIALEADSFVMGREYKVTLTWPEGFPKKVESDFDAEISLVSPLGQRIVAKETARPDTPTSTWRPGEQASIACTLQVAAPDETPHPSAPIVLDESHYLLLSLIDTRTGARMLIDSAPGPQPDQIGKQFLLREVFVSSAPLEIRGLAIATAPAGQGSHRVTGTLHYLGAEPLGGRVLCRVAAETGELLHESENSFALGGAGDAPLAFEWPALVAGAATISLEVLARGVTLTQARLPIEMPLPDGAAIAIMRGARVERDEDGRFITPITMEASPAPKLARVYAAGRLAGEAKGGSAPSSIACEPCFGYYDIDVAFGQYRVLRRIPATVIETRDGQLLVNGEPFIVKGLNVHALDPASPARTREMMRLFRGLGFNTLRMDAPPRWQVDMALEENLGCSLLPPFSVASSDAVFARCDGPPMSTARGVVRAFIERYGDAPAVLLWNSCNEIGGDTTDFLLGLYPAFKRLDPYARPVHYANLYGQDRWQGQDVMGVNYYFSDSQTAVDRQPVIKRSIEVAREHGLPVLYTEYNSYHGAIHETGADAVRNLFGWGLDNGMCGGFFYFRFNSKDHPGVIDDGFNTHKVLDDALREVFADAVISRAKDEAGAVRFHIKNRRDFTLRQGRLVLVLPTGEEQEATVGELAPRTETEVEIRLKKGARTPVLAEGRFAFVTHFGFRENVPFRLVRE